MPHQCLPVFSGGTWSWIELRIHAHAATSAVAQFPQLMLWRATWQTVGVLIWITLGTLVINVTRSSSIGVVCGNIRFFTHTDTIIMRCVHKERKTPAMAPVLLDTPLSLYMYLYVYSKHTVASTNQYKDT